MNNKIISILCIIFFLASCSMNQMDCPESNSTLSPHENLLSSTSAGYSDYRPPSQDPPEGLTPAQCPQFIILGFNDNQFDDGMANILSLLSGKTNPKGNGQAKTYDGAPITASFYNTPGITGGVTVEPVGAETIAQWKNAYMMGHEIGARTYSAQHGLQFTQAKWMSEIQQCVDFLVNEVGIPRNEIVGFRSPYLEYNTNLFPALKDLGFLYDSSYESGWQYWPGQNGSTLYWPFTLDNGNPPNEDGRPLPLVPGLWEIPIHTLFFSDPSVSRITGSDYNLWFQKQLTVNEAVDVLKNSLNLKYNGNRSPMNLALHTMYYSEKGMREIQIFAPDEYGRLKTLLPERIQALEEFILYALTLPDVRIVSAKDALEWVRNPLAPHVNTYTVTNTSGPNGRWDVEGAIVVKENTSVTFTPIPDQGYEVDKIILDGIEIIPAGPVTLRDIKADHTLHVTFKGVDNPLKAVFTVTQDWGSGFSGQLTLTNTGSVPLAPPREIILIFPGDTVVLTSMWNAAYEKVGEKYIIKLPTWISVINPGQSISIGCIGTGGLPPGNPDIIIVP